MKIFVFDISQTEVSDIEKNMHLLSADRQNKIKSKRMEKDKKLSYAAGVALRKALSEYDIEECDVEYKYTEHGKPYIQNKGKTVYFNLSHSGVYAVVVISESEVGIDIEEVCTYRDSVVEKCFSQEEKNTLINSQNKEDTFFSIWTMKESYLKATGQGITVDLSSVETHYEVGTHETVIVHGSTGNQTKAFSKLIKKIDGYIISLCSFEPIKEIEIVYMHNSIREEILNELVRMSDEQYREFSESLIPGVVNMLGVRLPDIRRLAKKYGEVNLVEYLKEKSEYFEEKMLKALMIGYATEKDKEIKAALRYLDEFSSQIDNWYLCDSFCNTFKVVRNDLDTSWKHIQKYLQSDKEFEVRIGLILILNHFIKYDCEGNRIPRLKVVSVEMLKANNGRSGLYEKAVIDALNREFTQGYYAMMAAAWATAEMFAMFPSSVYEMLCNNNKMDDETYNKAIQKICESHIPTKAVKELLKKMKRSS